MLNGPMKKRKSPKNSRKSDAGPSRPRTNPGIWIYGRHACLAVLANPRRQLSRLLLTDNAARDLTLDGLVLPIEPEMVDRSVIEALLQPDCVHQGIAILATPLPVTALRSILQPLEEHSSAVFLALDQANDPRNIGAILRTSSAFNVSGIIVPDRGTPEESGALAKAAAGALESVPLIRVTNLVRTLDELKQDGFWCVGLDGYCDRNISDMDFTGRTVVVLGAEGKGLRRLTRETCDHLCKISISSAMESLNLSNAAAITLYEISRQHR